MKKEFDLLSALVDRAVNTDYSKESRQDALFSAYNFKQAVKYNEYNAHYMSRALEFDRSGDIKLYLDKSELIHCLILSTDDESVSLKRVTYINITPKQLIDIDEKLSLYDDGASHYLLISQEEKYVNEILSLPIDEATTLVGAYCDSGILMNVNEFDFQKTIAPIVNVPKC